MPLSRSRFPARGPLIRIRNTLLCCCSVLAGRETTGTARRLGLCLGNGLFLLFQDSSNGFALRLFRLRHCPRLRLRRCNSCSLLRCISCLLTGTLPHLVRRCNSRSILVRKKTSTQRQTQNSKNNIKCSKRLLFLQILSGPLKTNYTSVDPKY